MKFPFFLLVTFLVFINIASANINITVQSENNKTLSIIDLGNNTISGVGINNQTFSGLTYTNYEIRLLSDTDLTVTDAVGFFDGAWNKIVYLALIIVIISFIYYLSKGLTR